MLCPIVGEVKSPLEGLRDRSSSALQDDPLGPLPGQGPLRRADDLERDQNGGGSIKTIKRKEGEDPDKSGRRRLSQKLQTPATISVYTL